MMRMNESKKYVRIVVSEIPRWLPLWETWTGRKEAYFYVCNPISQWNHGIKYEAKQPECIYKVSSRKIRCKPTPRDGLKQNKTNTIWVTSVCEAGYL